VELKACHTWDLCAGRSWLPKEVARDLTKAHSLPAGVQAFELLVVTHLSWAEGRPPRGVKYARRADAAEAAVTARALLERLGQTSTLRLDEEHAFGVKVEVDAWLCGPIAATANSVDRRVTDG